MATRIGRGADWRPRRQCPDHWAERTEDVVRTRFEPAICRNCYGKGHVYEVRNSGDSPVICSVCEGAGEL